MKVFLILTLLACSTSFADHKKAADIPECVSIAKSCETANFKEGDHKKNGRGLWLDCIGPISHGKTVEGVTGHSQGEAKKCTEAMKHSKKDKK